jgi:hypothetical protein
MQRLAEIVRGTREVGKMDPKKIRGIRRGVSLYSYSGEYGITMTLEDMFADIRDLGADGLEILANAHVEGYPKPTDAWVENWHRLIRKYGLVPVEYGHWIDSRRYPGRELTTEESVAGLIVDIKLAARLGFTVMRTKMGVIDDVLTPVKNWREIVLGALPTAKRHGMVMCPEIHNPTLLDSDMVRDYVDFIRTTGTKHFALNIDFGVMMHRPWHFPGMNHDAPATFSPVSDLAAVLPYTAVCHAKFYEVDDAFVETYIDYAAVVAALKKARWSGYLLSEYEGGGKDEPGFSSDQLHRHHVLLKRLLGR